MNSFQLPLSNPQYQIDFLTEESNNKDSIYSGEIDKVSSKILEKIIDKMDKKEYRECTKLNPMGVPQYAEYYILHKSDGTKEFNFNYCYWDVEYSFDRIKEIVQYYNKGINQCLITKMK